MTNRTGDRVNFGLLRQRLDRPDIEAMSTLPQEQLLRLLGAIIGEGSGCLTTPTFTTSTAGPNVTITFGPMQLGWAIKDADGILHGGVVVHDPNRPSQSGNSAVTVPIASNAVLWFRRREATVDNATRVHYPTPFGGEQTANTNTRVFEWCEFSPSGAGINEASGWFPFANKPAGSTSLRPFYFLGGDTKELLIGDPGMSTLPAAVTSPDEPIPERWGVIGLLTELRKQILLMKDSEITFGDSGFSRNPQANPNATTWRDDFTGLRQLGDLQNQIRLAIQFWLSRQQRNPQVLAVFRVSPLSAEVNGQFPFLNAAVSIFGSTEADIWWRITFTPKASPTVTPSGPAGDYSSLFPPIPYTGATIYSVIVQPEHPNNAWTGGPDAWSGSSVGRVAELAPEVPLPVTVGTGVGQEPEWRTKIRFRRGDNGGAGVPHLGYTVTVFGRLTGIL